MWSNYAYYLFITEFIGYIETERNSVVRGKLKELIGTANLTHNMAGFKASVAEIVGDTTDIATINTQILTVFYANYDKKEFLSAIENTVYEFDRMTMARLLAMSRGDRVAELVKISDGFTVENPSFDPTGTGFPNIYLPCSDLSQGKSAADYTFCVGTRLVVRSRREYAEFLADDLADPLRYKYLIGATWADTVVDPLKFTSVPTEIITIYRIM
jgi:hypothetical protein